MVQFGWHNPYVIQHPVNGNTCLDFTTKNITFSLPYTDVKFFVDFGVLTDETTK